MSFLDRLKTFRGSLAVLVLWCLVLVPFALSQTRPIQTPVAVRQVTFSYAAGAANITVISITAKDSTGNAIPNVPFEFWLSDSLSGQGITATSASTGIQVLGGTIINTALTTSTSLSSRIMVQLTSDNAGLARVQITDTGKTLFVPTVRLIGSSRVVTGTRLTTGNYGFIIWSQLISNLREILLPSRDAIFRGSPLMVGRGN